MNRDSFIIHRSFYEPIKTLSNEDKGALLEAICNYALDQITPENLSPVNEMAFKFIRKFIDIDSVKYQNITERNRKNIGKRWNNSELDKNTKNTTGKTGTIWNSDTDTDTDLKKENIKEKTSRFSPPPFSEIEKDFQEKIRAKKLSLNPALEAERFEAFYSSKNWMVGKNKMTDWRKAVSGWLSRSDAKQSPQPETQIKINSQW